MVPHDNKYVVNTNMGVRGNKCGSRPSSSPVRVDRDAVKAIEPLYANTLKGQIESQGCRHEHKTQDHLFEPLPDQDSL